MNVVTIHHRIVAIESLLVLLATALCLGFMPRPAQAALWGIESNAELINTDRTSNDRATTIAGMHELGAKVVRVNLRWYDIAARCSGQTPSLLQNHRNSCYNWVSSDEVIRLTAQRNMEVLISISQAPYWLHNSTNHAFLGNSDNQWNRSLAHYQALLFAAATRYSQGSSHGTVRLWTVWNEPNSPVYLAPQGSEFQRVRTARRYAQLAARSAFQIKRANPRALVAAGPTGPTGGRNGTKPITFLRRVQAYLPRYLPGRTLVMKRRHIDAWAHNPYPGFRTAPNRGKTRAPSVGMSNIDDLFVALDQSAILRKKPVWATEFGWETNPPDPTLGIAPSTQARWLAESFDWLDRSRRVTIAIWYVYKDGGLINDWQSGVLYQSGVRKLSFLYYQRAISIPVNQVRRGVTLRIWARSAVRPSSTRVVWSEDGRTWRMLPLRHGQKRADGSLVQRVRIYRTTRFATWDGTRGPARIVRVRG